MIRTEIPLILERKYEIMSETRAINKIIYGGRVLIDLTSDTVTADKLLSGYKAHGADGNVVNGACDYDMNTQEANATAAEILAGKKAGVAGNMVTGAMKNNGAVEGTISSKDEEYTVPQGYHDGSGKVKIHADEKAKLVANNIREGVTILGVAGSMTGTEGANPQTKTVTPSTSQQEILPDEGYNYLSQVTVLAIPYSEAENPQGGTTVTIG